uniref:Uncharacterized protein n=1 Tax=Hanusia phi TaxID=3032 RepID=A0A7S0EDS7_9CRYP|mmetsp:Transcript_22470/g.50636  ORF Transcript_22470/g.50636 Transcript_22470/m.50636 type:complete len:248 (+) Transcript_22470:145-888(+)
MKHLQGELDSKNEELMAMQEKLNFTKHLLESERQEKEDLITNCETLKNTIEIDWKMAMRENETIKMQLRDDIARIKASNQKNMDEMNSKHDETVESLTRMHRDVVSLLKKDIESITQSRDYYKSLAETKSVEQSEAHGDLIKTRKQLEAKEREIASLHERLEVREKTIEDQNRREASLRRQIAEVTCLKLEFEAKSDEQTKSIHSISLENLKLKEQLASLNDNLWGMLRVNRELRIKKGSRSSQGTS